MKSMVFGLLVILAFLAFEVFNYMTTDYALSDLLGAMSLLGIRWSTILVFAFCGIDFFGISRLFGPGIGPENIYETSLIGVAWLIGAILNAMLTWWAISLYLATDHEMISLAASHPEMIWAIPIILAASITLIRILIIGTFLVIGDRLFDF